MVLRLKMDTPKPAAKHAGNAIVTGQTLVEKRVIGLEQIQHTAVFPQDAFEKQLCLSAKSLTQIVIKIRILPQIRRH